MQDGAGAEGGGGMQLLLTILADGEEQARQLGELVADDDDPRSRTAEHYRGAARRLQCTLGKAVAVAKAVEAASTGSSRGTDDSPRSADESSGATAVASALETQERQGVPLYKRRKGLPRWTARFRVPDANLEATPDDGLSWRKYGQKDILGAKFPRGYYRCTYRVAQGCPATKQVQRSDADLCVFDVTYQGDHTCHQKQRHASAAACSQSHPPPQAAPAQQQHDDPAGMQLVAAAMGFRDVLKVETEEAAAALLGHGHGHGQGDASFCFPSVPFHHAGEAPSAAAFSPSGGSSYDFPAATHHGPAAAGSCYDVYDYEQQQAPGGGRPRGAESELAEVVSRAIAAPGAGAGFEFDCSSLYHQAGLDPHLPFPPFGGPSAPHGPYQ